MPLTKNEHSLLIVNTCYFSPFPVVIIRFGPVADIDPFSPTGIPWSAVARSLHYAL